MEQQNSFEYALQNLVELQRSQLDELRNIRYSQQTAQSSAAPHYAGREQTELSPYSLYSNQAIARSAAQGSYIPPSNVAGIPLSPYTQAQMANFNQMSGSTNVLGAIGSPRHRLAKSQQEMLAQQAGHNVANATIAGVGAVAGGAGDILMSGLLGNAFGLAGGLIGGATGGLLLGSLFNTGAQQVRTHQAYNDFLSRNSYMFIDRSESTNTRHGMGFSRPEMHQAAGFLRTMNTGKFLEDQEIQQMFTGFTEEGLLRTVSDLSSFKDKMSKLVDVVKSSALILNESYDNVVKMMGELERSGINAENFDYMAGKFKAIGSYSGQSASTIANQVVNMTQNNTQWTALDPTTAMNNTTLNMRIMTEMQRVAENTPGMERITNMFANAPGANMGEKIANMTNRVSQMQSGMMGSDIYQSMAAAFFQMSPDGRFVVDRQALSNIASGNYSATEISDMASKRLQGLTSDQILAWQDTNMSSFNNADSLDKNQIVMAITEALGKTYGLSTRGALDAAGIPYDADSKDMLLNYLKMSVEQGQGLQSQLSMMALNTQIQGQFDASAVGVADRWKSFWGRVGDGIGTPFTVMSDWMSDQMVQLNDWWVGRTPAHNARYNGVYDFGTDGWKNNLDANRQQMTQGINTLFGAGSDMANQFGSSGYRNSSMRSSNLEYTLQGLISHDKLSEIINEGKVWTVNGQMRDAQGMYSFEKLEGFFAGSKNTTEAILSNYYKVLGMLSDPNSAQNLTEYDIVSLNKFLEREADYLSTKGINVNYQDNSQIGYTQDMRAKYDEYAATNKLMPGSERYYQDLLKERNITNVSTRQSQTTIGDLINETKSKIKDNDKKLSSLRADSANMLSGHWDNADVSKVSGIFDDLMNGSITSDDAVKRFAELASLNGGSGNSQAVQGNIEEYAKVLGETEAGNQILDSIDADKQIASNFAKSVSSLSTLLGEDFNVKFTTSERAWWTRSANPALKPDPNAGLEGFFRKMGWGTDMFYKKINLADLSDSEKVNWLSDPGQIQEAIDQATQKLKNRFADKSASEINEMIKGSGVQDLFDRVAGWEGSDGVAQQSEREALINQMLEIIQQSGMTDQKEKEAQEGKGSSGAATAAEDHVSAMNEFLTAFQKESQELRSIVTAMQNRMYGYGYAGR